MKDDHLFPVFGFASPSSPLHGDDVMTQAFFIDVKGKANKRDVSDPTQNKQRALQAEINPTKGQLDMI